MRASPLPLLPFDHLGAEHLSWDATLPVTFARPVVAPFVCAHDRLHRVEVFIAPSQRHTRAQLWLAIHEGAAPDRHAPLRLAGPLTAESLRGPGWFAFEFEPIAASAGRLFRLELLSPDGAPGNAIGLRGQSDGERALPLFRAVCVRSPALWSSFQRHRAALERDDIPEPLMARLEISRPCNLACVMCYRGLHPYSYRHEAPAFLSVATVRALDPVLPGLLRVMGFGLGEPLLNPQFLAILRHLRARNSDVHVFTSTNGMRLTDAMLGALIDEQLVSELQISLDGNERATFEHIRRGASFDVVVNAFARAVAARGRAGPGAPSVTASMVVMKPNVDEVQGFIERMAALGVDRISLDSPKGAAFTPLRADHDAAMRRIRDQICAAAARLHGSRTLLTGPLLAEIVGWHLRSGGSPDMLPHFGFDAAACRKGDAGRMPRACNVPWQSFSLMADGSLQVCCNSPRVMGNVTTTPLPWVWQESNAYAALRHELTTRTFHAHCRACLGENTMVPNEVIPDTYGQACRPDDGQTVARAARLGSELSNAVGHLTRGGGTVTLTCQTTPDGWHRISGSIDAASAAGCAAPPLLAVAAGTRVRAYAQATGTRTGDWHWSAAFRSDADSAELARLRVFLADDHDFHPLLPLPEPVGPGLGRGAEVDGYVDEARSANGFLHLLGWARRRHHGGAAERVLLRVDGRTLQEVHPWLARPDVAESFGDADAEVGFVLDVPLDIARRARSRLHILAVDSSGRGVALPWIEQARRTIDALPAPPWLTRLADGTGRVSREYLGRWSRRAVEVAVGR